MTPSDLRAVLTALQWRQRALARLLDRPEATVRQWLAGTVRVPEPIAAWLERRAAAMRDDPPPGR